MGGGEGYRNGAVGLDSKGSGWKECASSEVEQECSSRLLPRKAWTPRGRGTQAAQAWSAKHTAQNYASPGSPALPVGSQRRQEGAEAGGGPDSLPPGPGTWTRRACHVAGSWPFSPVSYAPQDPSARGGRGGGSCFMFAFLTRFMHKTVPREGGEGGTPQISRVISATPRRPRPPPFIFLAQSILVLRNSFSFHLLGAKLKTSKERT